MGRWLVLGGTRFLSAHVAEAALARGHEVTCVARGSQAAPPGASLVPVDRDVDGALGALRGERFDAVVDVARMSLTWVRDALDALTAAHWTFVSSISVYADHSAPGTAVLEPRAVPLGDPDDYGAIKVASEQAVRAAHPGALIPRAGLICGPGDLSDRFGYWPWRFARGGLTAVPDAAGQAAQLVDVRDLADWIVRSGEQGVRGTFDATGPRATLGAVLDEVAAAVGAPDLDRVPVAVDALVAAGITPWAGPSSLPLWLPDSHAAMMDRDPSAAAAAGLRTRPIADTARAALAHERALDPSRERGAGLTPSTEHALLRP